jgi:hypothetical protein
MKSEQIQTLHPKAGKTNKCIFFEKYELIKEYPIYFEQSRVNSYRTDGGYL